MKKIAIIAFGIRSLSSLIEAIKIFVIKHQDFYFTLISDVYSMQSYCKNINNLETLIIKDKNTFDYKDTLNGYEFIIDLNNLIKECDFNFYFYTREKENFSLLVSFNKFKYKETLINACYLKEHINLKNSLDYIENDEYAIKELDTELKKLKEYIGIVNPREFFKLRSGIHLIEEEKLLFIKDFYNALNDKRKEASERKNIGEYFSKIVFSFQKDDAYGKSSYNLFSNLVNVVNDKFVFKVSEYSSSSDFIMLLMFIDQFI